MDFEQYLKQNEPTRNEKAKAWQTAIGLQAVDGLKPSEYLIDTAKKHIEGEITINEVQQLIKNHYDSKTIRTEDEDKCEEADKVSSNIAQLLEEQSFAFTTAGLTAVHRRIFNGVFKFAGKIRDYNITKKEWVLRGDTVLYVSAPDIRKAIEYDLNQEKVYDYSTVDMLGFVKHISQFVSGLWQIHPFGEGNTRTTAVFTIQYLRSLGFKIENDMFAKHSWYFRNALVRANYQNVQKGIMRDPEFLEHFFRNLLMGEQNELKNRYMLVDAPKELTKIDDNRTSTEQVPEQVKILISRISNEQLSLKSIMENVGLKHRPTFLENYLNPAISNGFVKALYPDKPNHPMQKYMLTAKGLALQNELKHS